MSIKTYQALCNRDLSQIVELAEKANYNERFFPLETAMMSIAPLKLMINAGDEAERAHEHKSMLYFAMPDETEQASIVASIFKNKRRFNDPMEDTPRSDWTSKYADHFTLLKEDEDGTHFIDCWEPKKEKQRKKVKDGIVLVKGIFDERFYYPAIEPYRSLDEDAKRILYLSNIREGYPPMSRARLLLGPTPGWVIKRAVSDFCMYVLPCSTISMYGMETAGKIVGGIMALLTEVVYHQSLHSFKGEGYYKRKQLTHGKNAIDSLVKEARSYN